MNSLKHSDSGYSISDSNTKRQRSSSPIPNLSSVTKLIIQSGFPEGNLVASSNNELYDQIKNDPVTRAAIYEMKSDPNIINPSKMNLKKLMKECNEMYERARLNSIIPEEEQLKNLRENRYTITPILSKSVDIMRKMNFFPREILDDSNLGKNCYIILDYARLSTWSLTERFNKIVEFIKEYRGDENWKDTLTVGKDGTQNGKTNERNFFECAWIALKGPFVHRRDPSYVGGNQSKKVKNKRMRKTKKKSKK